MYPESPAVILKRTILNGLDWQIAMVKRAWTAGGGNIKYGPLNCRFLYWAIPENVWKGGMDGVFLGVKFGQNLRGRK